MILPVCSVAQFNEVVYECAMTDRHIDQGTLRYVDPCDVDLTSLPTKHVRVTVHIFSKDDGSENIPNNRTGRRWITNMINSVNDGMGNIEPMNLTTSSPYFSESKIRYDLENIYFWNNTRMWEEGDIDPYGSGTPLYKYIQEKSISYKANSIHVLIAGNDASDNLGAEGRVSGIGDKKWTHLEDVYYCFVDNNTWDVPNLLKHEFGHNLSLYNDRKQDYCPDTPRHRDCWNGSSCSNNMMSNNACKCALTLDQVSRMHTFLHNEGSILLASGAFLSDMVGTVSSNGFNGSLNHRPYDIAGTSASVSISSPGGSTFNWIKTSGTGSFITNGSGTSLSIHNVSDVINFQVEWVENCENFREFHTFYNGNSLLLVGPNPARKYIEVLVKKPETLKSIASSVSGTHVDTYVGSLELADISGTVVWQMIPTRNSTKMSVNLQDLESGTYFLTVRTGSLVMVRKLLKI